MFLWLVKILALEVASGSYTALILPTCGYMNVLNRALLFPLKKKKKRKIILAPILPNSYNLFHYLERGSFLDEGQMSDGASNEIGSFPNPSCCNTVLLIWSDLLKLPFKKISKAINSLKHTHTYTYKFTCHLTSRLKVLSGWTTAAGWFYFLYHTAQV